MALAAVCIFWGTTYLGIRMALETFPPLMLVAIRYVLSGSILLAVLRARGVAFPRGRELKVAAVCGLAILGVGNGALTFAEILIPSGLAGLILTMSPFWLVGIEAALPGGQPLHRPTVLGMVIGFCGAALLFAPSPQSHESVNSSALAGFAILQIGMISWSWASIYLKRQALTSHPIIMGAAQQMTAGLVFAPLAALVPHHPIFWSWRGVGAILYLVFFGGMIGYSAYTYALDRLPVAVVSIYPYVNASVAVALGWIVYREPFGVREAAAMAVIFAGVAVVKWQSAKAPRS